MLLLFRSWKIKFIFDVSVTACREVANWKHAGGPCPALNQLETNWNDSIMRHQKCQWNDIRRLEVGLKLWHQGKFVDVCRILYRNDLTFVIARDILPYSFHAKIILFMQKFVRIDLCFMHKLSTMHLILNLCRVVLVIVVPFVGQAVYFIQRPKLPEQKQETKDIVENQAKATKQFVETNILQLSTRTA